MTSKCECQRCHGLFGRSEVSVYKGRRMCDSCIGDEQMWDSISTQEKELDALLSAQEDE